MNYTSAKWVVFSFNGKQGFDFNPGEVYNFESDAVTAAERLAHIHNGFKFFVAKLVASKQVSADPTPVETIIYT